MAGTTGRAELDRHLDVVWSTLGSLGVAVEVCRLPRSIDGEYVHARRLIRIQRGLLTRPYRSTLAHECGHAVFGDMPTRFGPMHMKQERRAQTWAAMALIDLDDYRQAEHRHDGNAEAMAVMLDVTVDVIDAYQHLLERIGDRTYLLPRMGHGQWLARVDAAR